MAAESRLVPRSQKDPRSWVRWVQGLGPWWILDLARPFCRGTLETQDLKILICPKTLETQDLKILICSETLETQDLKIWISGKTLETQNPEPQNFDVSRLESPWTLHHSMQNFMLSIVPGSLTGDKLGRSDSKT